MHWRYIVITCARRSKPPCCLHVCFNPVPVNDNLGDEDEVWRNFYFRKWKTLLNHILTTFQDGRWGSWGTKSGSKHRKSSNVPAGNDFEAYAEQLEFFCVANGVSDSKRKKAVLLLSLSTETYQLEKDLMAPTLLREDSLTHDTLLERLQKQLKPEQPNAKRGKNGGSGWCSSKAFS